MTAAAERLCGCPVPGPGNGNSRCLAPLRAVCQCECHAPADARDNIRATFRPAEWLSPEIRRHDGLRCEWRPLWIIWDGPWAGERAFVPVNVKHGPAWAPESELVDRE